MTFKEAKSKIVEALLADTYAIEERGDKSKNLLCDNAISNQDAAAIVQRTKGQISTAHPRITLCQRLLSGFSALTIGM